MISSAHELDGSQLTEEQAEGQSILTQLLRDEYEQEYIEQELEAAADVWEQEHFAMVHYADYR